MSDLSIEILKEIRDSIRSGNTELRAELHTGLSELRAEMHKGFAELRVEIAELRTETKEGFLAVRRELDQHARAIYASASDVDVRARFEAIERRVTDLEQRPER